MIAPRSPYRRSLDRAEAAAAAARRPAPVGGTSAGHLALKRLISLGPITPQQGRWLQQVVTGYFNYHAVPTNGPTLTAFLFHVTNLWRRTLRQRSQKDWTTWERIKRLADDWLPKPQILHPWPERRFAVRHPRWEPYARIGPVRICAGGRGNSRPYRESGWQRVKATRLTHLGSRP